MSVLSVLYAVNRGRMLIQSNRHLALVNLELGSAACERGEVGPGLHWLNRALRAATDAGDPSLTASRRANLAAWQSELPQPAGHLLPRPARSSARPSALMARPC